MVSLNDKNVSVSSFVGVLNFLKPHAIQEVVPSKNAFNVMSTHVTLDWKDG